MGQGKLRNRICHCGSGLKYKKCHSPEDQETMRALGYVDSKTKKILCYRCGQPFQEGEKIDWMTLSYGRTVPAHLPETCQQRLEMTNKKRNDTISP